VAAAVPKKEMVGADVFVAWKDGPVETLAGGLQAAQGTDFKLTMISNRGVKVWPDGFPDTLTTDVWRCRFESAGSPAVSHAQLVGLLDRMAKAGFDFVKFESLCAFDGKPGFSLGQGQ
jgi:isocitrate dehydrogenase